MIKIRGHRQPWWGHFLSDLFEGLKWGDPPVLTFFWAKSFLYGYIGKVKKSQSLLSLVTNSLDNLICPEISHNKIEGY